MLADVNTAEHRKQTPLEVIGLQASSLDQGIYFASLLEIYCTFMAEPAAGNYSVNLAAIPWQPKTTLTVEFRGAALFLRFMPCVPILLSAGL